jgi:hypothetical protein
MFTDYAACVLISFGLTALAMVAYGIGHLLKATGTVLVRSFQSRAYQSNRVLSEISIVTIIGAETLWKDSAS